MLIGCTGFLPGFLLGNVDEDWWIVQLTRVGISSCFFLGVMDFLTRAAAVLPTAAHYRCR